MAPACTIDFYDQHYRLRLGGGDGDAALVQLPTMKVYTLTDKLECDDTVATAYRKPLLYLVSRALERSREKPIPGMQTHSAALPHKRRLKFVYSDDHNKASASTTHGVFDNDPNTMNDVLPTILGAAPPKPFTQDDLTGL